MSKMLLPTELDTAMSPWPFLATARLESASGMLVLGKAMATWLYQAQWGA